MIFWKFESVVFLQSVAIGLILIQFVTVDSIPVVRLNGSGTRWGKPTGSFPPVPFLKDTSSLLQDRMKGRLIHITRGQRLIVRVNDCIIRRISFVAPLTDPGIIPGHIGIEASLKSPRRVFISLKANFTFYSSKFTWYHSCTYPDLDVPALPTWPSLVNRTRKSVLFQICNHKSNYQLPSAASTVHHSGRIESTAMIKSS